MVSVGGLRGGDRCLLCAREVSESLLLKLPKAQRWREELLKSK